ncbi:MAG TPA: amidase family protein, partial [Burkholderiales bacterium]|nr:amidase family protein [Burkholderiales bacterium]
IRIPAAFCGVFGFKPTWGVVPVYPHSPAWTLWHQGPLTRTVEDAALMQTVIAQPDARDWYQIPMHDIDYREGLDAGVKGRRIAYSRTLGYARVDPEVASAVEHALGVFEELGAVVERIDLDLADPIEIMQPLWAVALAMAVEPLTAQQRGLVDPPLLELARPGFELSALQYRHLEKERERFGRRMNSLHADFDLLITPQMPIVAFAAGHEVPPGGARRRWWEWSPFTYPFNLSQQPVAAVPCGFVGGLPVALQLIGKKFDDAQVLRAARAFESMRPFVMPVLAEQSLQVEKGRTSMQGRERLGAARSRQVP